MNTAPFITATQLSKRYGATEALRGVDVTIHHGESVAIMGPSGSGKTTLMHVLSGIITPHSGSVQFHALNRPVELSTLNSEKRAKLRLQHIGFVFQEGLLMPELTALENVAVALMLSGVPRPAAESTAAGWLHALGLEGMEDRRPGQLSGGRRNGSPSRELR